MSYTNVYPSRINWENEPSIASPINATNLNKLDYAAYEFDQTFATWDITKANQSDLLLSVKSIDYDTETGVFVFTWQNGTTKTVDLNIEKIPITFSMSPQGVITMTTDDGTTYTADVGSLIKTYTFSDSTEIDFTVTTDASGNKTVTAALKDGSIVGTKLEPNYLANCQSAANSASASKTAAEGSAEDSEAWAVGTRDGVPVPSTDPAYENNSYYWATHGASASFAGLTDTSITNPQNGQVPVYNSTSQKWENADQSAGGGSTIKVTTSESSLFGRTVTITCGTYTESGTFSNSGEVEFTGVTATGNFTITSSTSGGDTATASLSVPYFGNYTKALTLFSATITVTYPSGATCTISDGTTTLNATSNPMAFDIPNAGTWTAKATVDGIDKPGTPITITTAGQTATDTIAFGTINLTYDAAFSGTVITCVNGGTTISKTAPSGTTMVFYPPTTGEWVISGTVGGNQYSTSATVTSLSTPVPAELVTIPDGSTVLPTDDIQKWLNCAGIFDKVSYTALSDILSDSITFNALLGDSNACKYMARSTTWASTLCADQYAMTMIGQYDVCCDALLGNSTWASAIVASSYKDYVISGLVPTLASTTASVLYSGIYSGGNTYAPWHVFDNNTSTLWAGTADVVSYIGYQFDSAKRVVLCIASGGTSSQSAPETTAKIQGYDGSTWTDISSTFAYGGNVGEVSIPITNPDDYIAYRLSGTTSGNTLNTVALQFYGHADTTEKIHGANEEVAYYLDGATQVPISNPSTLDAGTYTFGSTIAKNPDSLATDYTKSIRITPNTVEVVLRPDKSIYWYGWKDNAEECLSTNGWLPATYNMSTGVTFNTNSATLSPSANNSWAGLGSKNAVEITSFHMIAKPLTGFDNIAGYMTSATTKSILGDNYEVVEMPTTDINAIKHYTKTVVSSQRYLTATGLTYQNNTRTLELYALWGE